jgi:hypothetical protein
MSKEKILERRIIYFYFRNLSIHSFTMPKLTDNKINNWKNIIENWDIKDSISLMDSYLKHIVIQNSSSNIITNVDRRAILFSTILCLCKAVSNDKWKFKEKIWLKKFNINDQIIISGNFNRIKFFEKIFHFI